MKYNVYVSETAKRTLGEHIAYIAEVDMDAAQHLKSEIIASIRSLDEYPRRYPFLINPYLPMNKYHKLVVTKYYLVIYQIKDDMVYVDYVVDARQDYQWLIK